MDTAKQRCAEKGADYYILNAAPFQSDGAWKVDGVCAAKGSRFVGQTTPAK